MKKLADSSCLADYCSIAFEDYFFSTFLRTHKKDLISKLKKKSGLIAKRLESIKIAGSA